jgi:hypothetical protein
LAHVDQLVDIVEHVLEDLEEGVDLGAHDKQHDQDQRV